MFGPCGISYVYFTYGMHFCLNVVAKDEQQDAGAVLIRAIKPLKGIDFMKKMRGFSIKEKDLTNGPAKLTQALCIDKELNNVDITEDGSLFFAYGRNSKKLEATPRVGIRQAREFLWRYKSIE